MTSDFAQATWRKSSRSGGNGGDCVEVAHVAAQVGLRDSKNASGPMLRFGTAVFATFMNTVKAY
jgi:hypothetical protein